MLHPRKDVYMANNGEGNGNSLQYSCLENPMVRGAWWATVHEVAKSQTQLKWLCTALQIARYNLYTRIALSIHIHDFSVHDSSPEAFPSLGSAWTILPLPQHLVQLWPQIEKTDVGLEKTEQEIYLQLTFSTSLSFLISWFLWGDLYFQLNSIIESERRSLTSISYSLHPMLNLDIDLKGNI